MPSIPALLCVAFAVSTCCFGQDSKPTVSPDAPRQDFRPALPNYLNLVKGFAKGRENTAARWFAPDKSRARLLGPMADARIDCAYIRVIPVPRNVDPEMILPMPKQSASRMPILKGMPACSEDSR